MCFEVISKSACLWTRIIALWVLVWFVPTVGASLCLFKCPARPIESPHSEHSCTFSPVQYGWSCGPSSFLIDQMTYHILWGSSLHYGRFLRACVTKWLVAFDTCSLFGVNDYAPPQISCLIEWLMAFLTLVHLASTVGKRMSLHFEFVLLR